MIRILFMLLFFALHVVSSAQEIDKQEFENLLDKVEKEQKFMGTLSIFSDGKEVLNSSRGYASIEDKRSLSEESIYRIGSVTKMYTATIILQIIEEGKLDFDTKLSEFFPNIPDAEKITIKNLLQHQSGLFNITEDKDFTVWMLQEQQRDDMLKRIISHGTISESGLETAYSNTNFILLSYIAEDIDTLTFKEIVNNRISEKLSLSTTKYGGDIDYDNNEVLSHTIEDERLKVQQAYTDMSNPAGAGAIIATATEVNKFISGLLESKIISKESFDLMTDVSSGMGMGLGGAPIMNMKGNGMSGRIDGFTSLAIFFPENKTSFTILTNSSQESLQEIMLQVLTIYFN